MLINTAPLAETGRLLAKDSQSAQGLFPPRSSAEALLQLVTLRCSYPPAHWFIHSLTHSAAAQNQTYSLPWWCLCSALISHRVTMKPKQTCAAETCEVHVPSRLHSAFPRTALGWTRMNARKSTGLRPPASSTAASAQVLRGHLGGASRGHFSSFSWDLLCFSCRVKTDGASKGRFVTYEGNFIKTIFTVRKCSLQITVALGTISQKRLCFK